METIIKLWWGH